MTTITKAERRVLERMSEGEYICFSRDGEDAWLSGRPRTFLVETLVLSLREKKLTMKDEDDEWGSDYITPNGRRAAEQQRARK